MRLERTVLLGATWGLLRTGLLLLGDYVSSLAVDSAFYGEYKRATLQLVILASIGISVLVGYSLASIRKALIALLLAQLVGFPVGLSTCSSILTRPVSTHTRPVIILVDRAR